MSRFISWQLLFFILVPLVCIQPISGEVSKVEANPEAGFHWPYLVLLPDSIGTYKDGVPLIVAPNNTGRTSDSFAIHLEAAEKYIRMIEPMAMQLHLPILMPVFPRPSSDWRCYVHALDRETLTATESKLARVDEQLLAMIHHAHKSLEIRLNPKSIFLGFSASGMFVNRFVFLHPDAVLGGIIGSPGGWPLAPAKYYQEHRLRFPIGIADLDSLVGKPLEMKRVHELPLYFFLGDRDDNDSVVYEDSYDPSDRDVVLELFGSSLTERWKIAEAMYLEAGFTNTKFALFDDVGHTVAPEMQQSIGIFIQSFLEK